MCANHEADLYFIVDGKKPMNQICKKLYNSPNQIGKTLYNPTEQLYNLYNPPTLTRRPQWEL